MVRAPKVVFEAAENISELSKNVIVVVKKL